MTLFFQTKGRKWVKSVHRFSHTHDVRAILCIGPKVVSVGVDSNLTVFDTPSKTLVKYPPIPHGRHIVLSPTRRLMTVRQNDTLDVWELGDSSRTSSSSAPAAGHLPVVQDPVKCLTMKMTAPISSFDVSSDGDRLVCVTTEGKIKMYAMQLDGKEPSVQKIPFAPTFTYLSRFNHVRLLGNCKQVRHLLLHFGQRPYHGNKNVLFFNSFWLQQSEELWCALMSRVGTLLGH